MKQIVSVQYLKGNDFNRTIVLPLDDCESSQYAVEWCKKNMFTKSDKIVLVNCKSITELAKAALPSISLGGNKDQESIHENDQQKMMECYASELMDYSVEYYIGVGDVKKDLTEFVDSLHGNFVVIGQEGEGIGKTLMGTVSTYLSKHCKAPVLIVKWDEQKEGYKDASEPTPKEE
ncbi:hypothetical protein HDV01_004220 [Terramyces sp. JEL0728]|nr:hypothetical protein HDV01_004220 [Terramyces sp. JEL0728]